VTATHTIGVLSPFVGGDYYGALLAGINQAAVERGGRIVAIQTLDPGARSADESGVPDVRRRIAWQHLDGVIVMPGAVPAGHVAAMQAAGLPVALVSHELPGIDCPRVAADNRAGVREAVAHLVAHGHRRIAFAGYLPADDVRERYQGYREAMAAHGLAGPADLLIELADNHESAGARAADRLLGGRVPATAVVMGTDRNAIGLIRHLAGAGRKLPDDLAVVGFDDIPDARYARPSLSSVRQPLGLLGRTAYELVAVAPGGAPPPAGTRLVATSFVQRDSCGCPHTPIQLAEDQARLQHADITYLQRTLNMQYELGVDLLRSHERDPRELAWLGRTPAVGGCLGLWAGRGSPEPVPDPGGGATDPVLELVGQFGLGDAPGLAPGATLPASAFPPAELFRLAGGAAELAVFVVPIRGGTSDWGLLAAVSRIQETTPPGREVMNQSGALLSVALEQDAMLRSLREQERQLRHAATYDHLTGLPNRTLFLDRLQQTALRTARDPRHRYAVLFLDLDGFKEINDTLGHAAGDRVLVEVARRISGIMRETDTAARFGGDEFLILLTGVTDERTPDRIAARIEASLAEPVPFNGEWVRIAASIGVARSGGSGVGAEELLRAADAAMYEAKSARKGLAGQVRR
jgi:diguanylate cyclase (GGDEF)-like protein